ncbi:MAG: hypothetical protein P9M06_01555 [Candidatus Saelkia tenebricola]|nr:hypothetical protein [Candidatus Saelkia tenebricola]
MKKKNILKHFIIMSIFVGGVSYHIASYANESTANEQPLDSAEFGSIAEIYKALSPELSLEEYLDREQQVRGMLIKRKTGEDAKKSYQGLRAALQILTYVRERFRVIENRRAELFNQPVRSATPGKSIAEDGSITYSGTNTKILKYFANKFVQNKEDLEEVIKKIEETSGKHAYKGFSLTFNMSSEDKLGNVTTRPLHVSLRDESTHFPDWIFSKQLTPTYAQIDSNDASTAYVYHAPSYLYMKYSECAGDWWAFNNKESNAFGYALKMYQELRDQWGVTQYITEDVLDMDFSYREARSYHRLVTIDSGETSYSYEEDTNVLDFHISYDQEGGLKYLPSVVEAVHYNDDQAPNRVTTSYKFYEYDENDRVVNSLVAVHEQDGSQDFFRIGIVEVDEFDPLTGLSPISQTSPNIMPGTSGDVTLAKKYAEIVWKALRDDDLSDIMQAVDMTGFVQTCWDVATQVIIDGLNYDAAKINVLTQARQKIVGTDNAEDEDILLAAAQSLNADGSRKEIEELVKTLKELRKEYGNKIALPHL